MIVTVASHKGGVGKTTTAVHLAGFLQGKAPTLLIDGDPQAITGRIVQILAHTQIPFRGDDRGVPEAQLNAGFRG
jgi:cellulose biosynthesis protein BcsQ